MHSGIELMGGGGGGGGEVEMQCNGIYIIITTQKTIADQLCLLCLHYSHYEMNCCSNYAIVAKRVFHSLGLIKRKSITREKVNNTIAKMHE